MSGSLVWIQNLGTGWVESFGKLQKKRYTTIHYKHLATLSRASACKNTYKHQEQVLGVKILNQKLLFFL